MAMARQVVLLAALALAAVLPLASAHGDEAAMDMGAMSMSMDMSHSSQAHSNMTTQDRPDIPSYFSHPDHRGLMYAHIGLMSLGWFIMMPVAVMLSIARSRLTIPSQMIFLATNAAGILASIIYNHQTPDLYENNSHHKAGWAITWIATAWAIMALLNLYTGRSTHAYSALSAQPASQAAMAEHQRMHDLRKFGDYRWSRDSGLASERNTESIASGSSSRSSSMHSQELRDALREHEEQEYDHEEADQEKAGFLKNTSVDRYLSAQIPRIASKSVVTCASVVYIVLERFMVILGFVAFVTGVVDYSGIGRGDHVFNILAHLIKGGIFVLYGWLSFGRFCGSFSDFGWSWNRRPGPEVVGWKHRVPSGAALESFVIFLYGITNIGLERLADAGAPVSIMDLEHQGISALYIGFGLAGMCLESPLARRLLDNAISDVQEEDRPMPELWQSSHRESYFGGDVMPALAIGSLGIIMAGHTQHSGLGGSIHAGFGTLFGIFALARLMTCVLLFLKPPKSYFPTRPFTEVIASFGLISGGILFVCSNKDTVDYLDNAGFHDALPILIVVCGLAALTMAWEVVLLAIKGAAMRKMPKTDSHPC